MAAQFCSLLSARCFQLCLPPLAVFHFPRNPGQLQP